MAETAGGLKRAKLIELDPTFTNPKKGGKQVEVQFNPESLKVTYANELKQPDGGDQASGTGGRQFVGAGTTKLALQLWFDVTAMEQDPVDDVRRLTEKVIFFMTPQKLAFDSKKLAPPGVRFSWGSFLFDGVVEGLEQTLEFFSPAGKPLRANISLTLSQQKILQAKFEGEGKVPAQPGRTKLSSAKDGDSVPKMAAKNGKPDWQSIAAANGIEDPLRLPAGQLLDLDAGISLGAGGSLGASAGVGAALGAGVSTAVGVMAGVSASASVATPSASLNASLGGGVSGSFAVN
jgi:Contractile injection system tube protein